MGWFVGGKGREIYVIRISEKKKCLRNSNHPKDPYNTITKGHVHMTVEHELTTSMVVSSKTLRREEKAK